MRHALAAVLVLVAIAAAGCNLAARTGIVRKDILTDAQEVVAETRINHGDMTIQGTVDHADREYGIGQPITLSDTVSKDAQVAILRVLANGDTTLVFPNKLHPKAAVAANQTLTVPGPGDDVTIAADQAQVVLFEFIASNAPGSWLFTRGPDKGSDFADLGSTTRALSKDITDSLKVGKGPETVASYLTVRVGGSSLF
jgi:hypothetical protein